MLSYAELQTVLTEVANIINDRAIYPKSLTEEDLMTITVNQLLSRNSNQSMTYDETGELHGLGGLQERHR